MRKRAMREIFAYVLVVMLALWLIGCTKPVYRDRVVSVSKPVPQPCAGTRPVAVPTLKERYPDWSGMDVRMKAAAVGKQALELRGFGEQLSAATGACR